jgi:Na+/H+ antiporter NhaD/arsenite permease-like protein
VAFAIFALSYVFIAGFRLPGLKLDRAGGALLGATAMIAFRVVTPEQAFGHSALPAQQAVNVDTLLLLFGMMLLATYLATAGFFQSAGALALRLTRTPRGLLVGVAAVSAFLSAFLVNDTVCVVLTPLVLLVVEAAALPAVPYLLAVCMASNAGSVATFTGNPQNMLIGIASGLRYARFAMFMFVPAVLSTAVVVAMLLFVFRRELPGGSLTETVRQPLDRRLFIVTAAVIAGVVLAFFLGLPMGWSALSGAVLVMTLSGRSPREALEKVDYVLLVFFASLFVIVYGVQVTGAVDRMRHLFEPLLGGGQVHATVGFSLLSLVASNLFSNVPYVMLARSWVPSLPNPQLGWEVLALSSTLAGNLTLIGSVANLIVFETARGKAEISFMGYLRVGVPVTIVSLALGIAVLLGEHALFGNF